MLLNTMSDQFDKVLDLAQKLKGPMVVYDKQGGKHLVILGIDEFAHYFDSNKKTPLESGLSTNTNLSQAPEIKAESGMDESIFEPATTVLPPELAPTDELAESEVEINEVKVEIKKNPPVPSSGQAWHRLGDVMRRVHPEIAPEGTQKPVPYQAHDEPVAESDEPNFLEEPTP